MQKKESCSGYDTLNTLVMILWYFENFVSPAKPLLAWCVIAFKNIFMHDFLPKVSGEGIIFIIIIIIFIVVIAIFSMKNMMVKSNSYFQCNQMYWIGLCRLYRMIYFIKDNFKRFHIHVILCRWSFWLDCE